VNEGRHTAIYIVLIFFLLVHTAIKDLDSELLDLDWSHVVLVDLDLTWLLLDMIQVCHFPVNLG